MLTFASDAHRRHHPREPIHDLGRMVPQPEVPERVERILAAINGAALGEVRAPAEYSVDAIGAVHTLDYIEFLATIHAEWREATGAPEQGEAMPYARPIRDQPMVDLPHPVAKLGWYSHDSDAIVAGTWEAASAAAECALSAVDAIVGGEVRNAYALCRPPGHHAAASSYAGYCFLNNAAIAAHAWTAVGARVAILDVDYHHGNGTQQIFYDRGDVLFVSLHADPAFEYPFLLGFENERGWGDGAGATCNYPLPAKTEWIDYAEALNDALAVIRQYSPDGLVVSLGVDTAAEDPDTFLLQADDYRRMGAAIATAKTPTAFVQEGGYCLDVIGRNVVNVLSAFEGA